MVTGHHVIVVATLKRNSEVRGNRASTIATAVVIAFLFRISVVWCGEGAVMGASAA